MKLEDKVTIEITYGELARAYYIMGAVNGRVRGNPSESLWAQGEKSFNKSLEELCKFKAIHPAPLVDYLPIQEKWESLLFPKSEEQKKIEELEETINKAKEQIEELKQEKV